MKFSERKKKKIRKQNERRIKKCCKHMIGMCIDFESRTVVVDQAKIDNTYYLLTIDNEGRFAIYKIIKVREYVKISNKRILEKQSKFSNKQLWKDESQIRIADNGELDVDNMIFV